MTMIIPWYRLTVNEKNRPRLLVKLSTKSTNSCAKVRTAIANIFTANGKSGNLAASETPLNLFSLLQNQNSCNDLSISHRLLLSQHLLDADGNALAGFESTTDNIEAILTLSLSNKRFGAASEARFRIEPGSFYDCVIPENIKSLWGPIPLQSLPPGVDNKCRAVAHG